MLIALDRQEKLHGDETASAALQSSLGIPVLRIAALGDVIAWLEDSAGGDKGRDGLVASIKAYRDRYCVPDG